MKKLYLVLIIIFGLTVLWVYYTFNPAKYSFFPACPFHSLTGLDCPGCGSQRALFCLLHGDVKGALNQNLLLVICLPFLLVHFAYKIVAVIKKNQKRWKLIDHPLTPKIVGLITIAFFIVRNLSFYPFTH